MSAETVACVKQLEEVGSARFEAEYDRRCAESASLTRAELDRIFAQQHHYDAERQAWICDHTPTRGMVVFGSKCFTPNPASCTDFIDDDEWVQAYTAAARH